MRRLIITLLALALTLTAASAQENLLQNSGFESEAYSFVSAGDAAGVLYNVPTAWGGGLVTTPGPEAWRNIHPTGFPHTANYKRSGGRSFHIARGGGTFTAWIYQQVFTEPGTPLRGGAFAYIESPGGVARVGIDPTGGANPFSPSVIWSTGTTRYSWAEVSVTAEAAGGVATLFLYATQDQPSDPNGIYWDDAYLLGTAGAPPDSPAAAPAADPSRQFVTPTVRLNVRSGPGLDFNRIGVIEPGDAYPAGELTEGWYAITYEDRTGYVSSAFVEVTGAGEVRTEGSGAAPAVVPVDRLDFTVDYTLRLRAAPTTDSATLDRIPYQQIVAAVGRSADSRWLQVQYAGQTGWVAARFGRLNGDINRLPIR